MLEVSSSITFRDARDWLRITGSERLSWLNGLVTCNLTKLAVGEAMYGLLLDKKGKIIADLYVISYAEHLNIAVPQMATAGLLEHFGRYLVMEDVEIEQCAEQGARVTWLHADPVPTARAGEHLISGLPAGVVGFIAGPGAPADPAEPELAASDARVQHARIAWDVPAFASEFGPTTYPQEARLETHAVSFTKGCYLGQEVVCMLEMRGKVKRRVQRLQATVPLTRGDVVRDARGEPVGEVLGTSATTGFAMLRVAALSDGAALTVGDAVVTLLT